MRRCRVGTARPAGADPVAIPHSDVGNFYKNPAFAYLAVRVRRHVKRCGAGKLAEEGRIGMLAANRIGLEVDLAVSRLGSEFNQRKG